MEKTIKIRLEDYKIIKNYSDITHIPIWFIIKKALKRYFGNRLNKKDSNA